MTSEQIALEFAEGFVNRPYDNKEKQLRKLKEAFLMFGKNEVERNRHKTINEQVEIIKDVLEEMMTCFDTEENRMDFILDICNGYKERICKPKSE